MLYRHEVFLNIVRHIDSTLVELVGDSTHARLNRVRLIESLLFLGQLPFFHVQGAAAHEQPTSES